MACLTCDREPGRRVIRVRRFLEVHQVAARAVPRGGLVVRACMARRALRRSVLPRQRESRAGVVVELSGAPADGRVATDTCSSEPGCRVIRVRRLLEIRQMAAFAGHRRPGILSADMTRQALHARVLAGQRKSRA